MGRDRAMGVIKKCLFVKPQEYYLNEVCVVYKTLIHTSYLMLANSFLSLCRINTAPQCASVCVAQTDLNVKSP